jgi:hypothetical protein
MYREGRPRGDPLHPLGMRRYPAALTEVYIEYIDELAA